MNKNIHKAFDYLGLPAFIFLFADTLFDLIRGASGWRIYARLIITLLGMIIDGYLVLVHKEK